MKAALLAGSAWAALSAAPARALDDPKPIDPAEPGMRRQVYNPHGRTRLVGTVGRSVVVTFADDETIKRVVFGTDSIMSPPKPQEAQAGGGAQAALGNNLPLWADAVGVTSLQVITQRPAAPDRVYQFRVEVRQTPATCGGGLDTRGCEDDADAVYGLAFAYPDDERARKAAEAAEARRAGAERAAAARERREKATAVARLSTDFTCVNGRYEGEGDRSIAPDDACDDGQAIGLLFKGNRQVPTVLLVGPGPKDEQAIRPTMRGDWLIVPALRERIRLRLGERQVVDVVNKAYNREGHSPGTGTGSPDVVREVVQAAPDRRAR